MNIFDIFFFPFKMTSYIITMPGKMINSIGEGFTPTSGHYTVEYNVHVNKHSSVLHDDHSIDSVQE